MTKKYCVHSYNGISLVGNEGSVLPCCKYTGKVPIIYDIEKLEDVFDSPQYRKIQKTLNSGEFPHGCWMCKDDETHGGVDSRRIYSNKIHTEHKQHKLPMDLEISLDYTCNLMCRICSPEASSKWGSAKSVIEQFRKNNIDMNQHISGNKSYKEYQDKFIEVWENSDLSKVSVIRLIGGEPFYAKHIDRFFQVLYNSKKDLSDVRMFINTNGTIFPNENILKYLIQTKRTKIDFSVDAEGELAECIRYGKSWKTIEENIFKWLKIRDNNPNIKLGSCITVSILNFNMLSKLVDFLTREDIDVYFNHLVRPKYLSVYQLSIKDRQQLIDKNINSRWKNNFYDLILRDEHIESDFNSLYKSIDILDSYQGKSFKEANAEMYKFIKEKANV